MRGAFVSAWDTMSSPNTSLYEVCSDIETNHENEQEKDYKVNFVSRAVMSNTNSTAAKGKGLLVLNLHSHEQ